MDERLKPCPFCGGEAKVYQVEFMSRVGCNTIGCIGVWTTQDRRFWIQDKAIEAWNTRAERTCKPKTDKLGYAYCGECGWNVGAAESPFAYCSYCGAKVVG